MADLGIYNPSEEANLKVEQTSFGDIPAIVIHDEEVEQDVAVRNDSEPDDEPPPYTEQDQTDLPKDPDSFYDASSQNHGLNPFYTERDEEEVITEEDFDLLQTDKELIISEQLAMNEQQQQQQQQQEEEDLLIGISLPPLEKLVNFSHSSLVLQRLVVTKELSSIIHEISLNDAVNIALPIIIQLGKDTEDSVREALAAELDKVMYFYYESAPPYFNLPGINNEQPHIPNNAFAYTIIEFLLDQNTALASIAQQSVVAVAAELAETRPDSDKYTLHQTLLNNEIFEGVVLGLISIFSDKTKEYDDNDEQPITENNNQNASGEKEKGIDTVTVETSSETTTAIVEKASTPVESSISTAISIATCSILKNYDSGGVNLAKMVCLMLMSALAPVFGPEGCTNKILPIVEGMVADPMFYVRKEAAAAVGSLSTTVPPDVTLERLLPLYLKLSVDTIWHVRRSCVFALPLLCEVLPRDMKASIAVEGIELFKNDVSRNVRNSLADITGEVISKFLPEDWKESGQPGQVPEQLLEFFLTLGNTTTTSANQMYKMDTDRIHNCAYNFPAVVLTAGAGYWDSHLKDTYLSLTKDYQLKVRRTFAYSLHDIARIIGSERTERDLVQIFALYLMDLDDVKQGVLEHLSEFLGVLATSSRNEYIPILAEVWDGVMNNWHLRDILAHQLRDIAVLFDAARVVEHILPLAIRACHDEFAAIRETGVEIFPVILDIVKRTVDEDGENLSHEGGEAIADEGDDLFARQQKYALALLNHVMEKLDDLVRSPAYRTRLVFTQICRSLLEAGINPADFASFFLPRLVSLAKDTVVNVRIATSRTIRTLCATSGYRQELEAIVYTEETSMEEEPTPAQFLDDILYHLAVDNDMDVRFFISEVIHPSNLEDYQKRKLVEELEVANNTIERDERDNADITSLAAPPTPPAHHIMVSSRKDNSGEELSPLPKDLDLLNGEEEISPTSAESPMDIVVDDDIEFEHDMEDETCPVIDQTTEDKKSLAAVDQTMYEEKSIVDHKMEDNEPEVPLSTFETQDETNDEDVTMIDDDTDMSIDDHDIPEKAQHIYLSKLPAHVVAEKDIKTPAAATTITHDA